MSREAFEKWYDKCVADCSVRLGTKAQEWVVWNAGYEAAQQSWIPVTESRDGANPDCPNDGYWICVEHKETKQRE